MATYNVTKVPTRITSFIQKQVAKLTNLAKDLHNPKIYLPLLLAMIIRFSLAPFTEQRWDMYIWRLNQAFVYRYHVNPFWPEPGAPLEFAWGYPPLWLFVLLLIYPFHALLSPISYPQNASALWNPYPWQNMTEMFESYRCFMPSPLTDLVIKTPIIIADALNAILIYKLLKSMSDEKKANYAYLAWLFNPYVIMISSVWGVFDSIPSLFVLLSLYYLISNKFSKSALMLSVGILFKLYPVILIPIFAMMILKRNQRIKDAFKYCLINGGVVFITVFATYFAFAFLAGQEPLSLSTKLTFNLFVKRASPDWKGQNWISGLTPLVILGDRLGATNVPISPILMSVALVLILLKLRMMKTISMDDIFSYAAITHFAIYMTYTVINPQHFIWITPILLIIAAQRKSSLIKYFYWALSILGLSSIFSTYDMSYHISPIFVYDYLKIFVSPAVLATFIGIVLLYLVGIKIILKKP